ncbi:MAG: urease subunit alpha [Gaiellales bacterium]
MSFELDRSLAALMYGPGEGDLVRLGDTNLFARVERSLVPPGEEGLIGAGRNIRDGQVARPSDSREPTLDFVVVNALVVDPVLGIVKADIGIRDGRIVGVGHAGNPDVQDGVDMVVGTDTGVYLGHGCIATAGAIDCHVHFLAPAMLDDYLANGYTTLIGGGAGLAFDVGTNPRFALERMFASLAGYPLNVALISRAASSAPPLEHALEWGSSGFKIHEDLGAFPAVIDRTLQVSDAYDVQTIIHTDTINESAALEDTVAAIAGRTIHAYHIEGAGGGHAPDLLELVGQPHVLPSSTNPTNPFTESALKEHLDMIMSVHLMNPLVPEDVAFAQSRVRPQTMAAEDVLHDLGAISMMGSDSTGMGHMAESLRRTFQLAHVMKERRGDPGPPHDDNERILRYLAKVTINPAIAHGIAEHVGSLEPGKLADIVLWRPGFFGVKPEAVIKSGFMAYADTGQGNGSTILVEPRLLRPSFGATGQAPGLSARFFVSRAALENPVLRDGRHAARLLPVRGTRGLSKRDLIRNDALPAVRVDPASFRVTVDGEDAWVEPATSVPLSRRYLLI